MNCTRILWTILNKSWKQHPTKQQLYCHLPPISKIIQIKWTRHVGLCWKSKEKLISDVLLWTPSHGRASVGRPRRTYLQQVCMDTGCSLDGLPGAMDDRHERWEKVKEILARSTNWWWGGDIYIYIYIYTYICNICVYIYVCVCVCIYIYIYVCNVCVYVSMFYVYVMYIYIYI